MTTATQKIPSGYKQTEIGVIPVDWDVKGLGSICKYQNGTSLERYFNQHDGYKVISIGNYSTSGNYIDTGSYISFDLRDRVNKFILNKDDLTMILNDKTSTGEIIGRVLLIEKSNCYVFNQRTMRLTPDSDVLPKYLYFLINSNAVHKKLARQAKPGTQIYFNTSDILDFKISFPKDKTEQSTIIDTLADADILIKKLEKLIEKKKNIKQGLMQELLTGKRRLHSFNGDWTEKNISDLCGKITTGKLNANAMVEDGEYRFYTCAKDFYQIDHYAFNTEALLVSGNGANVGYIHYYKGKFNAYQRTYVLSDFSADIHFIKLFMDRNLQERIRVEVNAGNTPYITMGTLADMQIMIPPTKEEQTAIANVLSDIDTEIEKLESQLTKYQNIKQGMMQTLLTGKIRLLTK